MTKPENLEVRKYKLEDEIVKGITFADFIEAASIELFELECRESKPMNLKELKEAMSSNLSESEL